MDANHLDILFAENQIERRFLSTAHIVDLSAWHTIPGKGVVE
jgi:hypothetical protein